MLNLTGENPPSRGTSGIRVDGPPQLLARLRAKTLPLAALARQLRRGNRNQSSHDAVQDSDVTDLHVMARIQDQEQCHPGQECNQVLQVPHWDRGA